MAQKQLILDQSRNLGDVISDGFTLVRRNFKVIGGLFLVLVFPFLLFALYNMYFVFSEMDLLNVDETDPFSMFGGFKIIIGYGLMILSFLIYYFIIFSSAITYQRNNNETPDRYMVINFMKENAVKYIIYFLAMIGMVFVMMAIMFLFIWVSPILSAFVILGMVVGMFYLFPFLNIFPLVYLDSDLSFIDALKDTIRLIKGEWWSTFGVILITNIIGSFASYILIIPVYAIMMVQMMSSDNATGDASSMMSFWMGIMIVVSVIASTIVLIYTASAVVLKYYDLRESKDSTSLYDKIDSIGSGESSMFENEGEF
ncbi:hypothetical protein [Portibacter lacus]|uniref:Glycerophosphoryl diester phosphodiesterase membrane domain-containing protein n=1 Tax=Portibacter lacus TaxID=1099794 RepID=A0AA37SLQ2_9BACT|nr:hypothetical protein [Portibacter lacus]GLR16636.1 hypothetical protein GCM10007940_12510 [Portibacter lacus]